MAVLRRHVNEELCSQVMMMEKLFMTALWQDENLSGLDEGQASRWLNGLKNVSPRIITFYLNAKNRKSLCGDIEKQIFPLMADRAMAIHEMYALLGGAPNVSREKKEELMESYKREEIGRDPSRDAELIADLVRFVLQQNFVARDVRRKQIAPGGATSPVVKDYIFSGEMPQPCPWFRGREEELARLHELLLQEGKVFLGGIPGIGKSELAKAYAKRYKKEYTNIVYIRAQEDLRRTIAAMDFADDADGEGEDVRFYRHERFLRTLREDTLLIVDNYNTKPAVDAYLDELLQYGCRVLITTRCTYEDMTRLDITEMPEEDLLEVIRYFYPEVERDRAVLTAVIFLLHNYTYAVELIARLLRSGMVTARAIRQRILTGRFLLHLQEMITGQKDNKHARENYDDHIRTVFALCDLSEWQKKLMRCMTLVSAGGIHVQRFLYWMNARSVEPMYDLVQLGLVQNDTVFRILLHPVIRDVVIEELKPSVRNCWVMLGNVQEECTYHGMDRSDYLQLLHVALHVIDFAEKDDVRAYFRFLDDVYNYMERYKSPWELEPLAREQKRLLQDPRVNIPANQARMLDKEANALAVQEKNWRKAAETAQQGIDVLGPARKSNALLMANLYSGKSGFLRMAGDLDGAKQAMQCAVDLLQKYKHDGKHDSVVMRCSYAVLLAEMGESEESYKELQKLLAVVKRNNAEDCLDCADIQKTMASVAAIAGNSKLAWEHARAAEVIYKKHLTTEPASLALTMEELKKITFIAQQRQMFSGQKTIHF